MNWVKCKKFKYLISIAKRNNKVSGKFVVIIYKCTTSCWYEHGIWLKYWWIDRVFELPLFKFPLFVTYIQGVSHINGRNFRICSNAKNEEILY